MAQEDTITGKTFYKTMHIKQTISFCPTCYKRIPSDLYIEGGKIWMRKICSDHGMVTSIIENDEKFYRDCFTSKYSNRGYPGYFLDVTSRCNLSCKHCYYRKNNSKDPSIESLFQEAHLAKHFGPIILIGGEPTVRNDIVDLISKLYEINKQVAMITNGVELDSVFEDLLKYLCPINDIVNIELSIHPESNGADIRVLEMVKSYRLKLDSVLFMIDDVKDISNAIDVCHEYKDIINSARLRAPSKIWAEDKNVDQIFVSDMLQFITDKYETEIRWWDTNQPSYFNINVNGMHYILVSWANVYNIDLVDKAHPPFYMSKSGSIDGILTSLIINEGIEKGWLNGRRFKEL